MIQVFNDIWKKTSHVDFWIVQVADDNESRKKETVASELHIITI